MTDRIILGIALFALVWIFVIRGLMFYLDARQP